MWSSEKSAQKWVPRIKESSITDYDHVIYGHHGVTNLRNVNWVVFQSYPNESELLLLQIVSRDNKDRTTLDAGNFSNANVKKTFTPM